MMAADYRHIGSLENRLGRHYTRFSAFWPAPALAGQSLALRKLCDAGSNRRSRVSVGSGFEGRRAPPLSFFCERPTLPQTLISLLLIAGPQKSGQRERISDHYSERQSV